MSKSPPPNPGPDPDRLYPLDGWWNTVFLKPLAEGRANVDVGDFAYYSDPDDPTQFFERNVLHHYEEFGDRLIIGRFAMIAAKTRIIMNGGTHAMSGFSTYPFNIFAKGWDEGFDPETWTMEHRGDTVIGPDVWIGTGATIMPGARIGPGAIVAAGSVVTGEHPAYAVLAGNPARQVRRRFDDATAETLERIAWWDWPITRITEKLDAIRGADLAALEAA